jgi:hypothetical protein
VTYHTQWMRMGKERGDAPLGISGIAVGTNVAFYCARDWFLNSSTESRSNCKPKRRIRANAVQHGGGQCAGVFALSWFRFRNT